MDSAVVLAEARARGFDTLALSVRYGQRHACELEAARRVARALGAREHVEVVVQLDQIGGSALTADLAVPKDRPGEQLGRDVPVTYVPARNTVFLSIALGLAEARGARDLFVGVNAIDYSGYPDCRPEFLRAFEALASVATAAGTEAGARFRVHAPLLELGVDFSLTHTCYDPLERGGRWLSCGRCDACQLRLAGFARVGVRDPIAYVE